MSRKKSPQLGIIFNTGERIKKIRGGLTQAEFGKLLGVRGNTVSRWEAGRLSDYESLKRIADFGGVTIEWLLKGEEPPLPLEFQEHAPENYSAALSDIETALLTEVVTVVHQVIAARRLKFTPAQTARLIVKTYDDCRAANGHPSPYQFEGLFLSLD